MDSPDLDVLEIEAELRRRRRARLANLTIAEARPPAAIPAVKDEYGPEAWTEAERLARNQEVQDLLREVRRGIAESGPGCAFADDPMAHGSNEGGGVDSWLRNL